MARVVKKAVYGTLPSQKIKSHHVISQDRDQDSNSESSNSSTSSCSPRRRDEFLRYEEEDSDEEDSKISTARFSHSFVDFINRRTVGERHSVGKEFPTRHLLQNGNFRERWIRLGEMNKIFCSRWLNDRQVVFGSKDNKLSVYDVEKRELFSIPLLKSQSLENGSRQQPQCGIHSISINPSQTVLATGAENTNDIAFYSLPTFDPLAIGEGAHDDWMFDLQWLDDVFCVSGSRDTTMALWKLPNEGVSHFKALSVKKCKAAEKVRALAFNPKDAEVAALSLNGYIHLWKADTFKQMHSQKLHHGQETVCLSYQEERNVYAVGSRVHTTILDARSLQPIQNKNISSVFPAGTCCGIRSVSFRGDILTIGTGTGSILFYDLRVAKYMMLNKDCKSEQIVFRTNTGWVAPDDALLLAGVRYTPAVYTHCYDESGLRLFAAGGPLAVERRGNYASIWS